MNPLTHRHIVIALLVMGLGAASSVQAQWQPWAMQPFDQLDARFSKLNLAALWPQAPITQVSGELTISPLATSRSRAALWGP